VQLEQRVKTLEYEMKILKNEIQRTLLDIQEQILIHYYPALRADDTTPTDGTIQAFEAVRARQPAMAGTGAKEAAVPAAKKVSLDEALQPTGVQKVALEEVRTKPGVATAVAPSAAGQGLNPNLSAWVNESVATIGKMRTIRLVELYSNRGALPSETSDVLVRLASTSKDTAPDKVPVNKMLTMVLKLYEHLGRAADVDEALAVIEEARLG
jgi:hypothetical protein